MFFNIVQVDAGANEFVIFGDYTSTFINGYRFVISQSTGNDGIYTVIPTATFDGTNTTIPVAEDFVDITNDGKITGGLYSIDFTDTVAKTSIDVVPHETNNDLSITIPGRGSLNYGEALLENLVHMLEHFAGDTAPANGTIGQLWFDTSTNTLNRMTITGWTPNIDMDIADMLFADPEHPTAGTDIVMTGSGAFADVGLQIRPTIDPVSGDSIFRILSADGTERLRVEHDGSVVINNKLDVNTHLISNVVDPVDPQDAATMQYVDDSITSSITSPAATEAAQDAIGVAIANGTQAGISVTYSDIGNSISYDVDDFTLTLDGDVSGAATITDLASATLTVTVADDSHTHDTQYYTEAELDGGQLDNRYYTETEVDALVVGASGVIGYKHTEPGPTGSTTWNIVHNLNTTFVNATIFVDVAGTLTQILPTNVTIVDADNMQVTFASNWFGQATVVGVV